EATSRGQPEVDHPNVTSSDDQRGAKNRVKIGGLQDRAGDLFSFQLVQHQRLLRFQQLGFEALADGNFQALVYLVRQGTERRTNPQVILLDEQHRKRVHHEMLAHLLQDGVEQLWKRKRLARDFIDVAQVLQPLHDAT